MYTARLLGAFLTIAAIVMPLTSNAADETYYRWLDDRGKLVISDRPPQDSAVEYEVVSQRSPMIRRVQSGEGAVPPEVTPRPGNEFESVDSSVDEEALAKNAEACERARKNLETLDGLARIRIRDAETGELRFLSEEDKEAQRQVARDVIRVHCQ